MARYVKLGNGAVLDADDLLVVVRKNINEYGIVLKTCPQITINADGNDIDSLCEVLKVTAFEAPRIEVKSGLEKPLDD